MSTFTPYPKNQLARGDFEDEVVAYQKDRDDEYFVRITFTAEEFEALIDDPPTNAAVRVKLGRGSMALRLAQDG